jgi:hypothetical protein
VFVKGRGALRHSVPFPAARILRAARHHDQERIRRLKSSAVSAILIERTFKNIEKYQISQLVVLIWSIVIANV